MQTQPSKNNGGLIETLFLYSEQSHALLQQALEREKDQQGNDNSVTNHRRTTLDSSDSESDEEQQNLESSSASASSDDESGPEEDPPNPSTNNDTKSAQQEQLMSEPTPTAPASPSSTTRTAKKPPKVVKPTQSEQQRQYAVKKHVENLTCDSFPINDSEAIQISTALLSKQNDRDLAERNYVPQTPCREYWKLSESLQQTQQGKQQQGAAAVMVLLLRSGRFAGGIFQGGTCLVHRACQRYTVRKGQGKAQSAQDASRRPKSMGAQLRRAGEEGLQQDIGETMQEWKSHIHNKVVLILLSCPKGMKKYLFDAIDETIFTKRDARLRRLPLDMGRPTFDNVCIAYQVMMTVQIRHWSPMTPSSSQPDAAISKDNQQNTTAKTAAAAAVNQPTKEADIIFPMTPLHVACQKGDLATVSNLLADLQKEIELPEEGITMSVEKMINRRVGPDFMTCLHYAAAASAPSLQDTPQTEQAVTTVPVDPDTVAECVTKLLVEAKADPTIVDSRSRPPYFLSTHDKIRDAFRMARAVLGEGYCNWDQDAKVGPALTEDDIEARKEREAEKKRKKRAKQKQKKADDKAKAEQDQRQREEAEQARKKEEEAKRVRDGLQPKAVTTPGTVCDFCQQVVKGRKRKDMFSRLDYVYCSAECVQKHKRELMAAAALSRFGGS